MNYNDSNIQSSLILGAEAHEPLLARSEADEGKGIFAKCSAFFFSKESSDSYVDTLLSANVLMRALKFLPALLITFGIELGNSAVLGSNQDTLEKHFTLVLFIPVISAIAGNIGLQTSSSVTAYINLRLVDNQPVKVRFLLSKYISHCVLQIVILSSMMGVLASFWVSGDPCKSAYGLIVFCGSFVNMTIAGVAGVWTPIVLNHFGYDPSSGAGPFETALQDVIGAIFFVYFAKFILASPWPKGCVL